MKVDLPVTPDGCPEAGPVGKRDRARPGTAARRTGAVFFPVLLSGCTGPYSWLSGAGREAEIAEALFWPMLWGAAVVWAATVALALYAFRATPDPESAPRIKRLILWGGAAVPTATVAVLLVAGLLALRAIAPADGAAQVRIGAEQWWWRVAYTTTEGPVTVANELRLPTGATTTIDVASDDVIHSFWVPALGGKIDAIPGLVNRISLTPVREGEWGGICAEFCGTAHAQMRFKAVTMPPEAFEAWLEAQARPAEPSALEIHAEGLAVFIREGCAACHAVRGTAASGVVGPDLTHLASRDRFAAGILPLTPEALARWIDDPESLKPDVQMPATPGLAAEDMRALTSFLMALE